MAARKSKTSTIAPFDVTHTLATAKPSTCGAAYIALRTKFGDKADLAPFAAEGCRRLPRHSVTAEKGHVAEKPRGLMTAKQRASLVEARKAARVTKSAKPKLAKIVLNRVVAGFRVVVRADGTITSTAVEPKAPQVTNLPEAESTRQVAAPAKVTRTTRRVSDPTANKAVSRVSRKAAAAVA
jgi:hypothetical protein